jgi:hypothetical protein
MASSETGVPLQRISWGEKIKNNKQWFKDNLDYRIAQSTFGDATNTGKKKDLGVFYNVYNNQFPLDWFKHITNPLSTTNERLKNFPAKIRPTAMLRANIDLLLNEYPTRPFAFQVDNLGEDAYNSYLDGLVKKVEANLSEHFLAVAQAAMKEAGHQFQEIPQDEQVELPDALKERYTAGYKDNLAIRGQRWMKRAIREYNVRGKLTKMFKDWLISGYAFSYKNMESGNFVYERVSPREVDYVKSPNCEFIEDAEVVIRKQLMTLSEVVDRFYDEIDNKAHEGLEQRNWSSPATMYTFMSEAMGGTIHANLIPVYHMYWKGKKLIKYITYTDPLTGQIQEDVVMDEDTLITEGMTVTKTEWINEGYEGWRIGDNLYCKLRALPIQRNEMNNFSRCKGPYNGRLFSDTHSENISVLELGLPFAIMYMITDYTIEKTVAKNKGKILMIDQKAIPTGEGWDEDTFFYYSEALGYMLVDRSQQGVDKTMNQYHVMDMSTLDQIKELILLRDSFAKGWDDVLGLNPQRKAQISASEGLGTMNGAIAQSSVITNGIFTLFEEFVEKDLQGILDFSKFINVEGVRAIYNSDDFDTALLDIDPNTYCNADLGLFVTFSAGEMQSLERYKSNIQAMLQNGVKQSTILEIAKSNNLAELTMKLKRIEEIEIEQAEQSAQSEHEKAMEIEGIKERYLRLSKTLDGDNIDKEWDRRNENEMLKGEYAAIATLGATADGDVNDNGVPDAAEIGKRIAAAQSIASAERLKLADLSSKERMQDKDLQMRQKELDTKKLIEDKKAAVALKNKVSGEKP